MSNTRQGVKNLNYIKSSEKNPRVIDKYRRPDLKADHVHEWGHWYYAGDGMDNCNGRDCYCGERQYTERKSYYL